MTLTVSDRRASDGCNHRLVLNILWTSRPIITAEAFEAVDWLADLPQQTWPQAGWSSDVILLKSSAAILAAAMFIGDRTTASTSLAGTTAVVVTHFRTKTQVQRSVILKTEWKQTNKPTDGRRRRLV